MTTLSRLRSRSVAVAHATALVAAVASLGVVAVAPAGAADRGVAVVDNAYDPGTVEVTVGDTVTWVWAGENPHSVSAPGTFDSHPQCTSLTPDQCGTKGDTFSFTPSAPGAIEYRCRIHTDMTGVLTVRAAPTPEPSSPPPPPPSPSPTSSSSPTPAPPPPSPTPEPTTPPPAPSPTASPSASPSPSRTPVGPPTSPPAQPVPTITPTATPSATASPTATPSIELTPFPSTIPLPDEDDPLEDDVVAVDVPGGDDGDDTPVKVVAAGIFGATALAFGRFVLFGPPWS